MYTVCFMYNYLTNTIVILKSSCGPIIINSKPLSVLNLYLKDDASPSRGGDTTSSQLIW